MRVLLGPVAVAVAIGCHGHPPAAESPAVGPPLPPPAAIDPGAPGAAYLADVGGALQPRWAAFLEDCRLRLPSTHRLNATGLVATYELAIDRSGAIVARTEIAGSGDGDFDTAIADVLADAAPLPPPPEALRSDDDLVYVRWQFARDRRQAGAATARLVRRELPIDRVAARLLEAGELPRAARRVAGAGEGAPGRLAATSQIMIAALREALEGADGAARRLALETCGRAHVHALADAVRAQLSSIAAPELRAAAVAASAALGDRAAVPALLVEARGALALRSRNAQPKIAALVALGHGHDAVELVRAALGGDNPIAIAALAIAPIPALSDELARWGRSRDAAIRGAVCAALPGAAPDRALALIARGLADADATVRAACLGAASRVDLAGAPGALRAQVRSLARDRDHAVRANAVGAIAAMAARHPAAAADAAGAVRDPAALVRAAAAAIASPEELRGLLADPAAEVRAAAVSAATARGAVAPEVARGAARDPAPAVRRAAVAAVTDLDELAQLARDASPEVATAALVRRAALVGRAASAAALLEQLASAPAASTERVRIALAWLLAS